MSNVFLSLELLTPGTFTLELEEEDGDTTELMTFDYSDPSKVQCNVVMPSGSMLGATPVVIVSGDDVMDDPIPFDVTVAAKNVGSGDIWMSEEGSDERVTVAPEMSVGLEFFSGINRGYIFGNG